MAMIFWYISDQEEAIQRIALVEVSVITTLLKAYFKELPHRLLNDDIAKWAQDKERKHSILFVFPNSQYYWKPTIMMYVD